MSADGQVLAPPAAVERLLVDLFAPDADRLREFLLAWPAFQEHELEGYLPGANVSLIALRSEAYGLLARRGLIPEFFEVLASRFPGRRHDALLLAERLSPAS